MVLLIRGSIYNSSCVRFIPAVKTRCHFQFDSFSPQRKMEVDEGKERRERMAGKKTRKSMFKEYFNIIGMTKKPSNTLFLCSNMEDRNCQDYR